jgi:hypothetical protein
MKMAEENEQKTKILTVDVVDFLSGILQQQIEKLYSAIPKGPKEILEEMWKTRDLLDSLERNIILPIMLGQPVKAQFSVEPVPETGVEVNDCNMLRIERLKGIVKI